MWIFTQKTGQIAQDAKVVAAGWAGQGKGKNNPDMQDVESIGPLPCGLYTIQAPHDNPHTGPFTMDLIPDPTNQTFGRKDFRIHGAAFKDPELSSEGCIIQARSVRERIWASGDRKLQVVSGKI